MSYSEWLQYGSLVVTWWSVNHLNHNADSKNNATDNNGNNNANNNSSPTSHVFHPFLWFRRCVLPPAGQGNVERAFHGSAPAFRGLV